MENISRKSSLQHLRFMANNRSGKRWLVDWPREYCKPWLHSIVTSPSSSCSDHLDSRAPANSPAAPGASLWSCQWGDPGLRESHCRGGICPGRWVAVFQLWTPATWSCLVSADSWFVEQSFKSYRFIFPLSRPVLKDKVCDVSSTLTRTEQILFGLPTHEDQP